MMYNVIIMPLAEQEAQANRDWWATNRSAEQATRWYEVFAKSVLSLEQKPDRCVLAPESGQFAYEVRQLNFGIGRKATHRLVYENQTPTGFTLRQLRAGINDESCKPPANA